MLRGEGVEYVDHTYCQRIAYIVYILFFCLLPFRILIARGSPCRKAATYTDEHRHLCLE